jgi:hypothetical protein
MKSSKNNLTLKPDVDLKNKLKNNMYFYSSLKDTIKHRQKLVSENKSSSMASLGMASLEKTLMSRQKSESELVPLNSARGVVRPMETLRSLNLNLYTDTT